MTDFIDDAQNIDTGLFEVSPPSGTNWSCPLVADLRQIARHLRHIRCDLMRDGDWYDWASWTLGLIAFLLTIINSVLTIPTVKILIPIFVGIVVFADFAEWSIESYDTAFELTAIIDSIRSELLLPVPIRIDGIIYLQQVQTDRNTILSDYRQATAF